MEQANNISEQQPRVWLTVDEAFVLCQHTGLNRTKKTIRSWCRQEHLDSQKQVTPTGERWMVEKSSLQVKIRNELEFQRQAEPVETGSNWSEQVRTKDAPVRTGLNEVEPVRPRPHREERNGNEDIDAAARVIELERQIRSLEIDKAVRDRHVEFLAQQNEVGRQELLGQSRYIGHLETQLQRLGGRPDQTFLQPPIRADTSQSQKTSSVDINPNQLELGVDERDAFDPLH